MSPYSEARFQFKKNTIIQPSCDRKAKEAKTALGADFFNEVMTSSVFLVGAIDALLPSAHNPSRRDTPNCTDTSENHLVHTALAPSQTGLLCEGAWTI